MLAQAETDTGMFLAALRLAGPMKHYVTPCITGKLRITPMFGFVAINPDSHSDYNT
jgi:hypothetical protein